MPTRGRKPRKDAAGKPDLDAWEAPSHLSKAAREAWQHLVSLLSARGNLARTDPTLVETYAVNVDLLRQAQAAVAKDGVIITNGHGAPGAHPACAVANMASMRIKGVIEAVGLTPSSSTRTAGKNEPAKVDSKWGGIFGGSAG